jgi:hypothetical protein
MPSRMPINADNANKLRRWHSWRDQRFSRALNEASSTGCSTEGSNHSNPQILKVAEIAGRKRSVMSQSDASDQGVA